MNSETVRLLEEGWTPRIKHVRGRKYITLRKGNREKSLGPYSDDVWRELMGKISQRAEAPPLWKEEFDSLKEQLSKQQNLLKDFDLRIKSLERYSLLLKRLDFETYKSSGKSKDCKRIADGFCMFWRWQGKRKPSYFEDVNAQPKVVFKKIGKYWYARAHPLICGLCGEYLSKIDDDRLKDVEKTVANLPIKNAYENFVCNKCESKHWIAVKIQCTKCGAETWWGYWPKT